MLHLNIFCWGRKYEYVINDENNIQIHAHVHMYQTLKFISHFLSSQFNTKFMNPRKELMIELVKLQFDI